MCDADLAKFGGPEWVEWNLDWLVDAPSGELEDYEAAMPADWVIADVLTHPRRARSLRAALWIARRRAGVDEAWSDFNPHVFKVDRKAEPPAGVVAGNAVAGEGDPTLSDSSPAAA